MISFRQRVLSICLAISFACSQLAWAEPYSVSSHFVNAATSSTQLLGFEPQDGSIYFLLAGAFRKTKFLSSNINVKKLLSYFLTALSIPDKNWWVNLNALINESEAIGYGLAYTDLGQVLLSADLRMKKLAMHLMDPDTSTGQALLDALGANELNVGSLRFWIEPKNAVVYSNKNCVVIKKAVLRVRADLQGSKKVKRAIEAIIVPALEKHINFDKSFSPLRVAYKALILASWYKKYFRGRVPRIDKTIDSYATPNFLSSYWTRREYLAKYNKLYLNSVLMGSEFVNFSAGGFNGSSIPEVTVSRHFSGNLLDRSAVSVLDISNRKALGLVHIGFEGPAPADLGMRIEGNVDISGIYRTGPVVIISEYGKPVKLADMEPFRQDKRIGNEIIWIKANGQVERIEKPFHGKRGIFVSPTKAIGIDANGKIFEENYPKDKLISFGTAGWRFKLPKKGDVKSKEKLLKEMKAALEGFADYYFDHIKQIQSRYGKDRFGVVIVRDSRALGDEFVDEAINILTKRGIYVYTIDKNDVLPTPLAAYATYFYKTAFAINFTASHNPPDWSGFKVTPLDGGPAQDAITKEISKRINEHLLGLRQESPSKLAPGLKTLIDKDRLINSYSRYVVDTLEQKLGKDKFRLLMADFVDSGLKIVPTALYGASGYAILRVLKNIFGKDRVEQNPSLKLEPKSDFGNLKRPEPNKENTEFLKKFILRTRPSIGVALDGDGDRFAVRDSKGNYISPNQFLALVVYFLHDLGVEKGVVKTVPTSDLALAIAKYYNLPAEEMKVGFKWAKQFWHDENIAVVGEESAHLGLTGTKTYDDGVLGSVLAVLMESYFLLKYRRSLSEMVDHIQQNILKKRFSYVRENVKLTGNLKNSLSNLFSTSYELANGRDLISGEQLSRFDFIDWDSLKKSFGEEVDKLILIDGIKFVFKDGSWFAIRLSGTEPVARLYVEAVGKTEKEALAKRATLTNIGRDFLNGKFIKKVKEEKTKVVTHSKLVPFFFASLIVGFVSLSFISTAWAAGGTMSILQSMNNPATIGNIVAAIVTFSAAIWVVAKMAKIAEKISYIEWKYYIDDLRISFRNALRLKGNERVLELEDMLSMLEERSPAVARYLASRLVLEGINVSLPVVRELPYRYRYGDKKMARVVMDVIKEAVSSDERLKLKPTDLFDVDVANVFSNFKKVSVKKYWSLLFNCFMLTEKGLFFAWKLNNRKVYLGNRIDSNQQTWLINFLTQLSQKDFVPTQIINMLSAQLGLAQLPVEKRGEIISSLEKLINWEKFKKGNLLFRVVQLGMFLNLKNIPNIVTEAATFMLLNSSDDKRSPFYYDHNYYAESKAYKLARGNDEVSPYASEDRSNMNNSKGIGNNEDKLGGVNLSGLSIVEVW